MHRRTLFKSVCQFQKWQSALAGPGPGKAAAGEHHPGPQALGPDRKVEVPAGSARSNSALIRLDRRHSSLHPDNRIAPVTTLVIGQTESGDEPRESPWLEH